jgi:hypothetical protein
LADVLDGADLTGKCAIAPFGVRVARRLTPRQ